LKIAVGGFASQAKPPMGFPMSQYFPTPDRFGHHTIFGNIPITTLAGDHIQLSWVVIPVDGVVDWHAHANEQMGGIVSGRARFQVGDEEKELGPGDMYHIPGGVRHRVTPVGGPVTVLDVFYPIRDEYR
jgi:quercetin dioxygenase-like cupin family protein